jgi:glycine cleavage system pyridoxal-binding protein P
MAPEDDKLVVLKKAPLNENVLPIDRSFLASLLRTGSKSDESLISAAVSRSVETEQKKLRDIHKDNVEREVKRRMDEVGADAEKFRRFREAIGDVSGWMDDAEMISAIRSVITAGVFKTYGGLGKLQKDLAKSAEIIAKSLGEIGKQTEDAA